MRPRIIGSALILSVALGVVATAWAQQKPGTYPPWMVRSNGPAEPPQPADPKAKAKSGDPKVYQAGAQLPAPDGSANAAKVALPTEPIEPYLLQPENGPFMVNAYVFRDPYNAAKMAQMLAMELRREYKLPAYVFYLKVIPGNSYVRNIPPTAPPPTRNGEITPPEKYRIYDEAAVLVGDCKSLDESLALMKKVKKIHPKCLNNVSGPFAYLTRKGLSHAMMTQNPLVPSQYLFPGYPSVPVPGVVHGHEVAKNGQAIDLSVVAANFEKNKKPDPMVKRINDGPHSIFQCPGQYTMPIATFTGHATTFLPGQSPDSVDRALFSGDKSLKKSPLGQAADDAEWYADALDHCPILKAAGFRPYVYHDRSSSRVTLGAFHTETDSRANELRKIMKTVTEELGAYASKVGKKDMILPFPSAGLMAVPRS